jgi:hypothetical protein
VGWQPNLYYNHYTVINHFTFGGHMAKKREVNPVSDGVQRTGDILAKGGGYYQGATASKVEEEVEVNPGLVRSSVDQPMTLTYNGDGMMLPPRGSLKIANINKLGKLPGGVSLIPLKK